MPKNILVVNDIPGAGKVAGNVNLPILSAGLLEVSILPTLILSKNTDYDKGDVVRHSLGQTYEAMLKHWLESGLHFDLYTTGFFESLDQIEAFKTFYEKMEKKEGKARLYVDPIMGDQGSLYPGFNQEIPKSISKLCQDAYLVMPNITEACLMTDYPYSKDMSLQQLRDLAQSIIDLGADHVVLSGIEGDLICREEVIGFYLLDSTGEDELILHKKYPYPFFGTGDMAMSLLISYHENGFGLRESLKKTGDFIENSLEATTQLSRSFQDGVYFEGNLLKLGQDLVKKKASPPLS